eukprot:CAMPEP_0172521296 /NCGR_PEP_ID=MMETSP1066-20121228/292501_1 /TAXON_ID=671091 /ORGANISM="Coscinodiscus wailesii, Strain CCMP2513" /LENGTH=594 /DNA_ID=CAMNT_0013304195 /DNA_START=531 /DNA_END=2315 /DNA_ORIENTATION=-
MLRRRSGKNQKPHYEEDDERWMHVYERLVSFKSEFGHTDVPLRWEEDESLGRWCVKQRFQHGLWVKNGCREFDVRTGRRVAFISKWRVDKLKELGFDFWSAYWKWEERLEDLKDFKERHGHVRVRMDSGESGGDDVDVVDVGLYQWVKTQRKDYNAMLRGEPTQMTLERVAKLEEVGFDWYPRATAWNQRYEQLIEYQKEHGNCEVPYYVTNSSDSSSSGNRTVSRLGKWVAKQRECYRSGSPALTPERIAQLERIGFQWNSLDANWNARFQELQHYKSQHGHCNVPINYKNNTSLGTWVAIQRQQYKAFQNTSSSPPSTTAMTQSRIDKLNDIQFIWDVAEASWNTQFQKLITFKRQNGHADVPHGYAADPTLWHWVNLQRTQYRRYNEGSSPGGITQERIAKLDAVGFRWNVLKDSWTDRFHQLLDFQRQFGHCNVPKGYANDPTLYTWVQTQRRQYTRSRQNRRQYSKKRVNDDQKERFQKLDSIGFCWNTKNALWKQRYEQLKAYKAQFGSCRVSLSSTLSLHDHKDNGNSCHSNEEMHMETRRERQQLARWVSAQRVQYNKMKNNEATSSMTLERVHLLEELGFEWSLK